MVSIFVTALTLGIIGYLGFGDRGTDPGDAINLYVPIAVNLANGHGYVLEGEFNERTPPAFALFLSAIYRVSSPRDVHNRLYRWVILVVQALTVAWVFLVARHWLTIKQAVMAAALLALNPVFLGVGVTRYAWNTASLVLCFFFLSLWLLLEGVTRGRQSLLFASGLARGVTVLLWPAPAWLWLIDIVYVSWSAPPGQRRQRLPRSLAYLAGLAVMVLPWLFVVHAHTGRFELSNGLHPSMVHGITTVVGGAAPGFVERALQEVDAGSLADTRSVVLFYLAQLRSFPSDTASFLLHKAAQAWFASIGGSLDRMVFWSQVPFWLLGLVGLGLAWRRRQPTTALLLTYVVYFWVITVSVLSVVRYMLPALGILAMFGALGADDLLSRWRRRAL